MAIYVPTISGYAPFYIHRDADTNATNILSTYGVVVKDSGYPMGRKAKQPYNNGWKDRDGDDEWNNLIHYEAFTYDLEGVIFVRNNNGDDAARTELKAAVRSFQNFIKNGEFSFFSDWHKFGFRHVRIEEFRSPSSNDFRVNDGFARVYFSFSVKVNDPTTDMTYNSTQNKIVTA